MKNYIYFYKDNDQNISILVGESRNIEQVIFLPNHLTETLKKDYPQAVGNLYVWLDGTVFKIDF